MPYQKLITFLLIGTLSNLQIWEHPMASASTQNQASTKSQHRAVQVLNELLQNAEQLEEKFRKDATLLFLKPRIADLLWAHNEPQARQIFVDTFNAKARQVAPELRVRLRSELIKFLLPHDPVLAEELATSVINVVHKNNEEYQGSQMNGLRQQATLMLQIADATESSEQAARLITRSFNGWLSSNHIISLQKLRRKSPALSDEIFLHALTIVQGKPTYISNKISILADYVFADLENEHSVPKKSLDPELVNHFLNFVHDTFVSRSTATQVNEDNEFGRASFDYRAMQNLIPQFEKYQPAKVKAFRERIDEITKTVNQLNRRDMFDSERDAYLDAARQNVSELIEKAKKENDKVARESLYNGAITALLLQGKADAAISLHESLKDEFGWKVENAGTLYAMAAGYALEQGKVDQAYEYTKNIFPIDDRVRMLLGLIRKIIEQGDVKKAKGILQVIKSDAGKLESEWFKFDLVSEVAVIETKLDPANSFNYLENAIKILNQKDLEKGLGGEIGIGYGPNGINPPMTSYDLTEPFTAVAIKDFPKAEALANLIKNKERMIWAKLAICKAALQNGRENSRQ